jgi:pimeloyl-ACP methyl ester carboxylesterase
MKHRIFGAGSPIVTIHPFAGLARPLPALTRCRAQVAIELDHGSSFDRQADGIAELIDRLQIDHADFFGESLGGILAIRMAIRHRERVDRVAVYGAALAGFEEEAGSSSLAELMTLAAGTRWPGFSIAELQSIRAPVLIMAGDRDIFGPRLEHHLQVTQMIPDARMAIVRGAGHFVPAGESGELASILDGFLEQRISPARSVVT